MEIDVNKERCLVCDSPEQTHTLTEPFPHSENFEILRKGSGSNTSVILNQQLSVIFLLRKVLRLDKSFLEKTLQNTGSNPSLWNLRLCRVCYRTFEEADFVFMRLRKLHAEFRELSKVLCKKLIQSVESQPPKLSAQNVSVSAPSSRTRKRKRRGRPKQAKKEVSQFQNDLEDSSLTVAERIRNAMFTQTDKDTTMVHDFNEFMAPDVDFVRITSPPLLKPCIKTDFSVKKDLRVQLTDVCVDKENSKMPDEDTSEFLPDDENDIEMEKGVPEENIEDTNNYDMDDTPDWNPSDEGEAEGGECDDEVIEEDKDSDSDFEVPAPKSRKRSARSKQRERKSTDGMGIILKAVKMENTFQYICPKCKEVFENAALCDEHILHKHYDGKWPKHFACHLCNDVSFRGEYWLRHHYEMRHPGVKLAVDETIERSIDEGLMPEITYEVIPAGKPQSIPENPIDDLLKQDQESEHFSLFNRTVDNPPANAFSIPVVQGTGQIRHLVLPNSMKRLPPEVLALLEFGEDEKPCKGCDKKYPTEIQLQAHIRRLHEGESMPYNCPMCPKKFERIGKVLIHVQRTHILSYFTCEKCGNHFKEEILLKAHIQRQHFGIEYPYKCVKCNVRYPGRSSLNKHLKRVHRLQIASYFLLTKKPKRKPGEVPKRRFRSKSRKKMERKYVCETCLENGLLDMKFVSEEELDTHIKRRHMGIPRPYPCPICDKRYSTPARVEDHMSTHTVRSDLHIDDEASVKAPPLPFVCHPCNKQFKSRALYNAHLKGRNHLDLRPFVCEFCSQGFSGIKYLKNHQSQKHHQELNIDPFKCKFCSKVLSSERTLTDHIKLHHTKDANYSCPYCDVQFQHISNMETHINALHTKSTQFLCPKCPKTFLRDYYLKNHMARVHCSKKPYECQHCGKEFSDKPTFNRHLEAHSGVIHSCPHCGKSGFKTRHALRVHRKTFHKEILEEMERKKKLAAIVKPQEQRTPISNLNDDDSISNEAFDNSNKDNTSEVESSKVEPQDEQPDNSTNHSNGSDLNFFL